MNIELISKMDDALQFLNYHPAVNCPESGNFMRNFYFWIEYQCKNNICKHEFEKPEDVLVSFYGDNVEYEKYKQFEDEDAKNETEIELKKIEVPYKEVYGYDWKLDHCLYVGEYSLYKFGKYDDPNGYIYQKSLKDNIIEWLNSIINYSEIQRKKKFPDEKEFCAYSASYSLITGETFEEMIIKVAENVKTTYGDFKFEDFLSKEEVENHKNNSPLDFEKIDGDLRTVLFNTNYILVGDYELNQRWWSWFRTTDYYDKHWKGE